jgi:DNA-binding YbaB/EbfC family protein
VSWLGNIGQMAKMMGQLPRLKEEMERMQQRLKEDAERMQQRLDQVVVEGDAGAGMVKVRMNGRSVMLGCTVSPEALALNDREMLEDLITAATNQALEKAQKALDEEKAKLIGGIGLPAGLNLPGMG